MNTASISGGKRYEAHDLLRLRALPWADDLPAWLPDAFAQAPFAVVRRADAPPGLVAVGFRGAGRAERYGAFVECEAVQCAFSPEQLLARPIDSQRRHLKAFAALRAILEARCLDPLVWGPTGSVGFELATMRPTATDSSDLDLLIRTFEPLSREHAAALRARLVSIERSIGLRIDAQLDTPNGGIALSEWADGKPRVMARSPRGPSLIADPWASVAAPDEAPH